MFAFLGQILGFQSFQSRRPSFDPETSPKLEDRIAWDMACEAGIPEEWRAYVPDAQRQIATLRSMGEI